MFSSDASYWGFTFTDEFKNAEYAEVKAEDTQGVLDGVTQSISETYDEVKTTVSTTVDTAKKVITVGMIVVGAALAWNYFGRDLYKIKKGTL